MMAAPVTISQKYHQDLILIRDVIIPRCQSPKIIEKDIDKSFEDLFDKIAQEKLLDLEIKEDKHSIQNTNMVSNRLGSQAYHARRNEA